MIVIEVPQIGYELYIILACAALITGFVDAVVGGGGMILLPSLFTMLPNTVPAVLLGTNKIAGLFGTTVAVYEYTRKITPPWQLVIIAAIFAFFSAILGAGSVQYLPVQGFRKALPFILLCLLIYTLGNKKLGLQKTRLVFNTRAKILAAVLGVSLGFYDGVFGPGTGSLLVFLWIKWFGLDFLSASCSAKIVNFACNLGALFWFVPHGSFILALGLWMAVFTMLGALLGARFTIKNGDVFIRKIFILIVVCLILRTSYDAFFR